MYDPPTVKSHDDQHIPNAVVPQVVCSEVEGEDLVRVGSKELPPGRPWGWVGLDHVATDRARAVVDTELELELHGDAVLSPLRVVAGDASDEFDVLSRNTGTARLAVRPMTPVDPVSSSVPAKHRLWFDDDESRAPTRPVSAEPDPEEPVTALQLGARNLALVDGELLPKGDDFEQELRS